MNILMVATTPFFSDRGCHIRIYEEAKALQQTGHYVRVVTYPLGNTPEGIETYRTISLPWYKRTAVGSSGKGLFDWKVVLDLLVACVIARQIWRFKPHVIYGHTQEGVMAAWLGRLFSGHWRIPLVLDAQGSLVQELTSYNSIKSNSLSSKIMSMIESFSYRISRHIFASSPNVAQFIRQQYPKNKEKVSLLMDSYHSGAAVISPTQRQVTREKLGIPENAPVLLYTGSFSPSKGFPELMAALPALLEKFPQWWVVLAGYPQAKKYQQELSITPQGERTVVIDSPKYFGLPDILSVGDVAIDPKQNSTEASGKIINYMAAGLPVIAEDNISNRNLLGTQCYYFKSLADLPKLLPQVALRKYKYPFIEEYSWKHAARKIVETLSKI